MRTDYAILKLEPIFGHHVIQSIRPEDVERFKSSRFKSHPHHITSPYVLHNPDGSPWKNPRKGFGEMLSKAGVPVIRNA